MIAFEMDSNSKICPFCKEEVKKEAIKCKHCGEFFPSKPPPPIRKSDIDKAYIPVSTTKDSKKDAFDFFLPILAVGNINIKNKTFKWTIFILLFMI